MGDYFKTHSYDDIVQVVSISNLRKNFPVEDEINALDVTSLERFLHIDESINADDDEDSSLQRLSLAHERLHSMPKIFLDEMSSHVKILDISHNEFEKLDFLKEFTQLTNFICDHNEITTRTDIPYLPKLELLWMNHCKIEKIFPWILKLQESCPSLKYLSLMQNPMSSSNLNDVGIQDNSEYRLLCISLFPHLLHLDDKKVTTRERRKSKKMLQSSVIERLVQKTQKHLPIYLRVAAEKVSMKLSETYKRIQEKNTVI
ncbi:leucine-rich melanocyte differentiation-associated protein [Leptinotarsa decemlineata]|uniref:leucine-rich melanocyte differentiation-associated protein n=1 Tax=Leptinotarsa decemlineata TaxID=7539 RepID=UPI003D30CE22